MNDVFFIEDLSPLYEDVQSSGIFADSKHFPDCSLLGAADAVLDAYALEKSRVGFDLKKFVETHFAPPPVLDTQYNSAGLPIDHHLKNLWSVLLRAPSPETTGQSTLLPLPFPYIVPGGRFREIYYWDSYFTMLGLRASDLQEPIRQMVGNFAELIQKQGFVPNGNRSYYLSRSQPPFFALMVQLLCEMDGHDSFSFYRTALEREYDFWMATEDGATLEKPASRRVVLVAPGLLLNRYWDDKDTPRPEAYIEDVHVAAGSKTLCRHIRAAAESGWDFSSRWFVDGQNMTSIHTADLLAVDLNCLLFFLEKTLLDIYQQAAEQALLATFNTRIQRRKQAILAYCWDSGRGFFFDYDFVKKAPSDKWTLAALFPLFFSIATPEQAESVAKHVEDKFLHEGGLCTTLAITGQQWDAPNGWAPLQWIAYKGLKNYGHDGLAEAIRQRWCAINEKTYASTGKMMEKYNVMDLDRSGGGGEYPNQDGFGWTNGVYLAMKAEVSGT
jgi:alpha,alpha-trehalase